MLVISYTFISLMNFYYKMEKTIDSLKLLVKIPLLSHEFGLLNSDWQCF